MTFEPTFTNTDESGLRTDTNGFGDVDYQKSGDEYGELSPWYESPLSTLEEEDQEELNN